MVCYASFVFFCCLLLLLARQPAHPRGRGVERRALRARAGDKHVPMSPGCSAAKQRSVVFLIDKSPFCDRAHGGVALEVLPRAPRGWGARESRRAQRARIAERSLGRSPLFASSARLHNHPLPRSSTSGHVVQKPPPRRRRRQRCELELGEPAPPTSSPRPSRAWSRPGRRTNRQAAAAPRARAGVMIWLSV